MCTCVMRPWEQPDGQHMKLCAAMEMGWTSFEKATPDGTGAAPFWERDVVTPFGTGHCDGDGMDNFSKTTPDGMGAVTLLEKGCCDIMGWVL